ncbi:hypothetical protein BCL57_001763 [Agromyces flavus]|uniref:Uncharacterized protein n=1 Tax=Agromyces flavus TaxID=589382 RepID=A0A1H1R7L7_9MICO|nr:hypothetical protein [Agromyces flavus]MCP2367604.1 hypothetical protein [Agromyces flavus]GGI47029.1 hypothetical protein GCM10010932_17510 [Agromyces flavus]SDS31680.1 hypothetical protein SAMN04489721_1112 [Agromyces flavus]
MAVLIDPAVRPAMTTWATALLIMNGGLFLIPILAMSVFGVWPLIAPDLLTAVFVLAALGITLMLAAWAAWRGSQWPRLYLLVVAVGEFVGLVMGYGYLLAALALLVPAVWLLWRPSAVAFAADASKSPRRVQRSLP